MAPFLNVPVGRNTLAGMMKTMALEGSLDNTVTNHSLRAYGVTKMFQCQVPKKLIMEHSGYRSLQGLRQYERTTDSQEMHVCQILDSTKREWYERCPIVSHFHNRPPVHQHFLAAVLPTVLFRLPCLHSADFYRRVLRREHCWLPSLLTQLVYTVPFCCCIAFLTLYSLLYSLLLLCTVLFAVIVLLLCFWNAWSLVLIDKEGVCLCCQVIIRC